MDKIISPLVSEAIDVAMALQVEMTGFHRSVKIHPTIGTNGGKTHGIASNDKMSAR